MLFKILFTVTLSAFVVKGISFDSSKHCSCSLLTEADCINQKSWCQWDPNDKECIDIYAICDSYTEAITCQVELGCFWNKNQECAEFTTCSDYTDKQCPSGLCKVVNETCTTLQVEKCSSKTTKDECNESYDSMDSHCQWSKASTCDSLPNIPSCGGLADFQDLCLESGCYYENGNCREKKCSDFAQTQCLLTYVSGSGNQYTYCSWNTDTNKCVEGTDASKIAQSNCNTYTLNNYRWSEDQKLCVACDDLDDNDLPNSYSIQLGVLLLTFILH
ncbi:unnamed protein product [Paramecium octaurelia]|uniref:Mini antigen n=1 Tax=Paramecium octaurelia TaxID=43137 RepID=A0A8S1VNJ6_PAROT|nr:unnamed protein product [Paramecium octaurelia]